MSKLFSRPLCEELNEFGLKLWVPKYPNEPSWQDSHGNGVASPPGIILDGQVAVDVSTGRKAFFDVGELDAWVPLEVTN